MSINPVRAISQIVEARLANAAPRSAPPSAPVEQKVSNPDAGTSPKAEVQAKQKASSSAELPQDEVHVQRDSQTNGDVVVQYTDHSGNLILQVPSPQVLGVGRAIEQDLRAEAKARTVATQADNEEGDKHGH